MTASELRKGLAVCPLCGKTILDRRLETHGDTPECLVVRVAKRYANRGWIRAGQHASVIQRANLPIERAPVSVDINGRMMRPTDRVDSDGQFFDEKNRPVVVWVIPEEGVIDGWWSEPDAVAAVRTLEGVRMSSEQRTVLVQRVYIDPELRAAIQTARSLGGPNAVRAYTGGE